MKIFVIASIRTSKLSKLIMLMRSHESRPKDGARTSVSHYYELVCIKVPELMTNPRQVHMQYIHVDYNLVSDSHRPSSTAD